MPPIKRGRGSKRKAEKDAETDEVLAELPVAAKKKKTVDSSKTSSATTEEDSSPSSRPFSHWLFKSEPETRMEKGVDVKFGFDDLKAEPDQTACWDGVRNYQARNFMKDQMRVGDKAFFYHRYH